MVNPWMTHMKTTLAKMRADGSYKKGDGLKKVIMAAKKTYKKTRRVGRRGGAGEKPVVEEKPVMDEKKEEKKEEEEAESESNEDMDSQGTAETVELDEDGKRVMKEGARRRGGKSKSKKKASRRTRRKLRR